MRLFIKIPIEGQCCQKFGICGEQFALDITWNDEGKVDTTRFRFMHKPVKYQEDYIRALVETRKQTDLFVERLKPNMNTKPRENVK
jgi:Niemann-Pick C1 protein